MPDAPAFPSRHSIRLRQFDYSQCGAYFVTICAHEKACLFGEIATGQMKLSAIGGIVDSCWREIPNHFPNVELRAHVAMPNHMHGLFVLHPRAIHATFSTPLAAEEARRARHAVPLREEFGAPIRHSVPTIMRSYKAAVSRRVRETMGDSSLRIWQRNYYERVIRDGAEFSDAEFYILENPRRWRSGEEDPDERFR